MNIIVVGVGGQGTIFTSKLLTQCALAEGLSVKTSEVFGMAQRGGSVISEIRIGEEIISPMIPEKEVDLLISYEMIETARHMKRVKPSGTIVSNSSFIRPYTVKKQQLDENKVEKYIKNNAPGLVAINGTKIAEDLGNIKVINTILIGACSSLDLLPFSKDTIENTIKAILPPPLIEVNLKALHEGLDKAAVTNSDK